jgi:hypothetical protein
MARPGPPPQQRRKALPIMPLKTMPAQQADGTTVDVEIVTNPDLGNDGEPKPVRDAWDRMSGAR